MEIGGEIPYQSAIELHTGDGIELADDYDNVQGLR